MAIRNNTWWAVRRRYQPGRRRPVEPLDLDAVVDKQGRTFLCPWPKFHHAQDAWRRQACPGCVPVTVEQLAAWHTLQPVRGVLRRSAQAASGAR